MHISVLKREYESQPTHTTYIITREATGLASEKSMARKKQLISFGGKDKLQKEELITIANMLIDELESKTLSLADLPDRAKLLVSEWPAPEEIA